MLPAPINPGLALILLAFWMESRIAGGLFVDTEQIEKVRNLAAVTGVFGILLLVQGILSRAVWGTIQFFAR